jgi:uncharacterized coiled-coil protein SlyX
VTRIPELVKIPAVDVASRVKGLEMQVIEHRQEIDSLTIRVLRAEQKIVKLKAKVKKLKDERDEDD